MRIGLAAVADEARREALPNIERMMPAARDAGVKVMHCLVQRRPDGLGGNHNAKIFAIGDGSGGEIAITPGAPGAELLPELGPASTDLVLRRWRGIGPMGGTNLDAVNKAYRVVLPRNAVAGIPTDYANTVIDNMLSLLATITTTDKLIEVWKQP
ncbi:isochorismatase [Mycobacterium gallinarum]|uniref:Isochorismatase n=2 Tax=Mycobacterium gallinarum TaxID=39689 RepID=A0A9W4B4D1_9MYCO|nr:isochorismatase [Mycobacterium gallinarum]